MTATAQASIFNARGWRERSPSRTAALRALLSDGRRHSQQAMEAAGGQRFGARLFDLHNETDINGPGPLHYELIRENAGSAQVFYRQTEKAHCSLCTKDDRRKPSIIIAELRKQIHDLEIRLAYAEGKS